MAIDRAQIMASRRRVVVKVGSAVLTTAQGLNQSIIKSLVEQLVNMRRQGRQVILVTSGAVANGRAKAGLGPAALTIPQKQAAAALGQPGLMQAYETAFDGHGIKVAQVLLTGDDLRLRQRFENARNTLFTLLDWGVVPIVNENDTVATQEIKLGDNDNLAAIMINLVNADLMIALTNVDGLLDDDPRMNPAAQRIPLVSQVDAVLLKAAGDQPNNVGAGGILSKIRAADKAARCGAYTVVANGGSAGILDQIMAGQDAGTLFLPNPQPLTSRKHWIAFAAAQVGALAVDQGAVKPLVEQGKSLLAAGIQQVKGQFKVGQAVRVLGPDNTILGVGISNYDSAELRIIQGLRSDQIAARLGHSDAAEVIHRDNLVVFRPQDEEEISCLLSN